MTGHDLVEYEKRAAQGRSRVESAFDRRAAEICERLKRHTQPITDLISRLRGLAQLEETISAIGISIRIGEKLKELEESILGAELEFEANPPCACWRCGANLRPPPRDVEVEIEANVRSLRHGGAYVGAWPDQLFRERCRAAMQRGDRIVGVRHGAITIRRADGSTLEIGRYDG
jgi:hypothetical protein